MLHEGVEVGRGCVIGSGVILSKGTKVPANTRLMAHPPQKEDDFESSDEDEGCKFACFFVIIYSLFLRGDTLFVIV